MRGVESAPAASTGLVANCKFSFMDNQVEQGRGIAVLKTFMRQSRFDGIQVKTSSALAFSHSLQHKLQIPVCGQPG